MPIRPEDKSPLLLGIDAGTSRVRALVFTLAGEVLAHGSQAAPTKRPQTGWAEQDPEAIWDACCHAVKTAVSEINQPARIQGLAIASVGEAFVPLDQAGQPTYPVIAWYDERPKQQVRELVDRVGSARLFDVTGLTADPTFSLLKLLWLKSHAADALSRTRRILNITHYLAWKLTGEPGSDYSLASRTLAFDLHRRIWADDMIRECGIDPTLFQPLRPLGAKLGSILPDIARALGLSPDCAVGVGGHDHLVGALAADALKPGVMLNSLGTAEAVTLALEKSISDPVLSSRGFNQGVLMLKDEPIPYVFGGFQTSGASIEWFRSLFGQDTAHETLIQDAKTVSPGSEGVTFVPDLRGKLVPHNDPLARGAWFGLNADVGNATLYRAILEGLAFEARQSIDALRDIDGVPSIESIRAIGGNTQNELLMRIKASVYQKPIIANDMPEATALGAALLGGLAAGMWPNLETALKGLARNQRQIEPVDEWMDLYELKYQGIYRNAYAALRPLNHALHELHSVETN
ncbi:MAG: FGGY-family carbohydrate kinase [Geminicoccaceae bacterium]